MCIGKHRAGMWANVPVTLFFFVEVRTMQIMCTACAMRLGGHEFSRIFRQKFVSGSASRAVSSRCIQCEGEAFVQGAHAKRLQRGPAERPPDCNTAGDCRWMPDNVLPVRACSCPWPRQGKRQEKSRTIRKLQAAENFPAAGR